MMENLFVSYLCLSAVLTVTALALSLTTHLAKRFASPHLTYGLMLAVMIIMLIPFRFELPEIPKAIAVTSPATYGEYTQANPILVGGEGFEAPLRSLSVSKYTGILSVIWASVAVTKLILHIVSYLAFVKKVKKSSYKADCPQLLLYTERVFEVRISGVIRTPFTTGVFRPILLLPESIQGTEKLKYVLAHEAVHINRHDMLFKWLTVTAKCIHWFNPFMYFVCRQLDDACEISCDASVTKNMDSPSKLDYMSTIIDLACAEGMKISRLTTALSSQGKKLKRRFLMIKDKNKPNRIVTIISVIIAVCLLCTGVLASGVLSNRYTKNNEKDSDINTLHDSEDFGVENGDGTDVLTPSEGDVNLEEDKTTAVKEADAPAIIWPCDSEEITAPFMPERSHYAVDIKTERGTDVYASLSGVVSESGFEPQRGNYVVLNSRDMVTEYAHLQEALVNEGETVQAGQIIGKVGSTGRATGPHLHFSAYIDGSPVDPASLDMVKISSGK